MSIEWKKDCEGLLAMISRSLYIAITADGKLDKPFALVIMKDCDPVRGGYAASLDEAKQLGVKLAIEYCREQQEELQRSSDAIGRIADSLLGGE